MHVCAISRNHKVSINIVCGGAGGVSVSVSVCGLLQGKHSSVALLVKLAITSR